MRFVRSEREDSRTVLTTPDSRPIISLVSTIVFHPFELVFGLHLGRWNDAVLTCRGKRAQDVSGLQNRFVQAPPGRRTGCLHRHFHAF